MSLFSSLRVRLTLLAFLTLLPMLGLFLFVEQSDTALPRNLILLFIATVTALAIAWIGSHVLIVRRVNALLRTTRQLSKADFRAQPSYDSSELGQLAHALDEMAAALQQRENEHRHVETALRESQLYLEKAQEVGHVGSWIASPGLEDGNIMWSKETYRIFGLTEDQFDGRLANFLLFVHAEDRQAVTEVIQDALEKNTLHNIEYRIIRPGGVIRWIHQQADIVRDENGNPPKMIGVVCDITDRKQAEETLQRYAAELEQRVSKSPAKPNGALQEEKKFNELKLRFASMMSHEFRTPLAAIRLSSDVLKKFHDKLTDDKRNEHLDKIQSRVKLLVEMLDQLLAISRADTVGLDFNPVSLNLAEFCRSLIEEMQHGDSRRIIFSTNGGCANFNGDEKLLQQIITNLLSNALKYSPGGGSIHFDLICENGQIVIRVKDEGIGIPDDDLKNLFETFHRAHNVVGIPGTGLGLAIARRAAAAHGGTIEVESKEGAGSTFTVHLPLRYNTPNPPQG